MNARKWLLILLVPTVCIPAAASAQIIIDRYNQSGDPTQPAEPKEEKEDDEKPSDEDAESKALTEKELGEVRDALLKQLQKTHAKCMKLGEIIRPQKAQISGTATWEVDEAGNAKFKQSTAQVSMEMFFTTDAEVQALSETDRENARTRSNQVYNDCAKGSDAKVDVKGKTGEVAVGFSVRHANDKTIVELSEASDNEGGSVAIDL